MKEIIELLKLADNLDSRGLYQETNVLDSIIASTEGTITRTWNNLKTSVLNNFTKEEIEETLKNPDTTIAAKIRVFINTTTKKEQQDIPTLLLSFLSGNLLAFDKMIKQTKKHEQYSEWRQNLLNLAN